MPNSGSLATVLRRRVLTITLALLVVGCTGRTSDTRSTLPQLTVPPTEATTIPDLEPQVLMYEFNTGELAENHSIIDLTRKIEVTGTINSDFIRVLSTVGLQNENSDVHLTGPTETIVFATATPNVHEVVGAFQPTAGKITVRQAEGEQVIEMTDADLAATAPSTNPFLVDQFGNEAAGPTGAPGYTRQRLDPTDLLTMVGPELPDIAVDLGDQWEGSISGPSWNLPITYRLERVEVIDGRAVMAISIKGQAAPTGQMPVEDFAGAGAVGDISGPLEAAGLDATVALELLALDGTAKFDPELGRTVASTLELETRIAMVVSRAGDPVPATVIQDYVIASDNTFQKASPAAESDVSSVLTEFVADSAELAQSPFLGLGEYQVTAGEQEALDVLDQALSLINPALIASPIAQTIVPAQGEPVTLAVALLAGSIRGDPTVPTALADILNPENKTEVVINGRTAIRTSIAGESILVWANETHLFLMSGPTALANQVMGVLMSAPPPYQWQAGDCLSVPQGDFAFAPFGELGLVHCQAPHTHEVIYSEPLSEPINTPRPADLDARVAKTCSQQFHQFVGALDRDTTIDLVVFLPDQAEWDLNRRYIACVIYDTEAGEIEQLTGRLRGLGSERRFWLGMGDCLRNGSTVPCTDPHDFEVIGFGRSTGDEYPGATELAASEEADCEPVLAQFQPASGPAELQATSIGPTQYEWEQGVREFTCLAVAVAETDGPALSIVGSFKDAWSIAPETQGPIAA